MISGGVTDENIHDNTLILIVALAIHMLPRDPLAKRIGHTDPGKYHRSRSHGSAGDMAAKRCCQVLGLGGRRGQGGRGAVSSPMVHVVEWCDVDP
jgi:hypothetical protein